MLDATWLFEHHQEHLALEKYLKSQMVHLPLNVKLEEAEEIESQVLFRPMLGTSPPKIRQGSSTEQVALHLQETREKQSKEIKAEYETMLSACRFMIELYDAVLLSLRPQEAWLIDKTFIQGLSLSAISEIPDCAYSGYDRSTIYRKRKKAIEKADHFIHTYISEEASQCQMEKFVNELKA